MKLAHAKSIVHHTAIETERLESLKKLEAENLASIEELNKHPNEVRDKLECAEAALSALKEEQENLRIAEEVILEEIASCKLQLQKPIGGLREFEQNKKRLASVIVATDKRLQNFSRQLPQAKAVIADYEAREIDRIANQIVDGALFMDQMEQLTDDERKERLKQIKHDKRVEDQKEKGKHYHRMIRRKTGSSEEDVVRVICHGDKCQFCPPKVSTAAVETARHQTA